LNNSEGWEPYLVGGRMAEQEESELEKAIAHLVQKYHLKETKNILNVMSRWFEGSYLSVDQISKVVHVNKNTIQRWTNLEENNLPYYLPPGKKRGKLIRLFDLHPWLSKYRIDRSVDN
jgi:hypothetical protein